MNPGLQKIKFLRSILEIPGLDNATIEHVKSEIYYTIPKYPFGSDTKRYMDQAIKMKKKGKTT